MNIGALVRAGRMPYAADDADEIWRHRKALMIARCAPELLVKCACMNGKQQSECEVCIDPEVPCIGCIRKRAGNSAVVTADCPVCWHTPAAPCPPR